MLLMYHSKEKAWEPRDSALVIFLGLKRSRRAEDKPKKQVGCVQHRATVSDKHIFRLPLLKFILKFSWSESLSPNIFVPISWELTSCQELASKYTSSAWEDQILILDGIKQPAVHLSSSTSSKRTSLAGRWGEKVWIDLWDLGDFSTSAASGSGAHSYVEMLLRLSSVQVSLYPRLTVREVITAAREIYGGGSSCPFMLVYDPPTCRLFLSFKIFISIFTAFSHTRHTQSLFFLLKTVGNLHPCWKDQENTWGERGRDSMRIYLRCIIVMGLYTMCVHTYLLFVLIKGIVTFKTA